MERRAAVALRDGRHVTRGFGDVDRAHANTRHPACVAGVAFIVSLVSYAVMAAAPPFHTRGEPREALVVRSLLDAGPSVVPGRDGAAMHRKPPMFHWLAAAAATAGVRPLELAIRLPSVIFGAAGVAATAYASAAWFGNPVGVVSAVVLATSFEWQRAATQSRVDMTLTLWVLVAILALHAAFRDPARSLARRGGWLAAGAAVLAKGPVGVVLPALVVTIESIRTRSWRDLRRLLDAPILLLVGTLAVAWYAWGWWWLGGAFLRTHLFDENVARFIGLGKVPHAHGPLYYLGALAGGFFPWTLVLPSAIVWAWRRRDERVAFLVVWACVTLLFYTLARGKRSVYLLPMYPAVAMLTACALVEVRATLSGGWTSTALAVAGLIAFAIGAGVLGGFGPDVTIGLGAWIDSSDRDHLAAVADLLATGSDAIGAALLALGLSLGIAAWPRLRAEGMSLGATIVSVGLVAFGTVPLAERSTSRRFAREVDRIVPADAVLCRLGDLPDDYRFYSVRQLLPCGNPCVVRAKQAFAVRRSDFDARSREACLAPVLASKETVDGGAGLRLDRIVPGTSAGPRDRALPAGEAGRGRPGVACTREPSKLGDCSGG